MGIVDEKLGSVQISRRSCVITVERQSGSLIQEFTQILGRSFGVESNLITCLSACGIDGRKLDLISDEDIADLNDSYSVSFDLKPPTEFDQMESATHHGGSQSWSAEEWEQYNADNWVNDASGYLAVCGKMSAEEENELILQVVEAFTLQEDNKDGIGIDPPVIPRATPLLETEAATAAMTASGGRRNPRDATVGGRFGVEVVEMVVDGDMDGVVAGDGESRLHSLATASHLAPIVVASAVSGTASVSANAAEAANMERLRQVR